MKTIGFILINCLLVSASLLAQKKAPSTPPNVVLILIDDAGLMDLGAFGGEAQTPNIDKLAKGGMMFTNMHASPVCAPSRAMLMTGSDSHLAGVANLPEMLPKEYQSKKGYEGVLNNNVQTIATRLKEANYNTYICGKWHLGHDENTLPTKRGFDRSLILAGSGGDNYSTNGYLPFKPTAKWFADGQKANLPDEFYSSELYIDRMINFHKEEQKNTAPFFSFISFQAVHAPVQAPKKYVEKYIPIYEKGWDILRAERFAKAKTMGIIPQDAQMNAPFDQFRKWDDLSDDDKKSYATDMAMMAGMLEAMDENIGRYIQYLTEKGLAENTVFIVTSDNGPDGANYYGMHGWAKRNGYHRDFENKGGKGFFGGIGSEFASAIAAPFSYYKYYTGEGGLRVPLIVSGVDFPSQKTDNEFCFITDIAPTIYDLVGISTVANEGYAPLSGKSMLPYINGTSKIIRTADEGVGLEAAVNAAYFLGDYKIVKNNISLGDNQWRMYNLKTDPTETNDIAAQNPLMFQIMLSKYEVFAKEVGVQQMPNGYSAEKEVGKKSIKAMLNPFK
jgi:arylsulfatase A-like enzyme